MFKRKSSEVQSLKSKPDSAAATQSHFKVSAKRDSALLPEHGHPSGWVNLASDKAEAAKDGDKWHSKA
jgi:hypothetical protein